MGEFFVRRPIVAMVISIVIVIIGLLALRSVPISQYPEITPPTIKITTSFVGANAVNVEQGVAAVMEQKINGVEEMIYMKSTNASDGNLSLEYAAAYPARYGAEVEIELADGARHAARVPDALGDPENPLDAAGIRAKALALMNAGGLDAGRAGKLADACLALARDGKVSDVAQALP